MIKRGLAALAAAMLAAATQAAPAQPEMTIVLTGQSLIQSDIREAGPHLRATAPLLKGDVVFTNFETTVREPGASLAGMDANAGVYAPPEALDALKGLGFNLLSMANNHIYDIGEGGLLAADRAATARGLAHSGIGRDVTQAAAPAYLRTPKGVVALVSMATGFLQPGARATADKPGLNELALQSGAVSGPTVEADAARILAQIAEARRHADLVVVYHHNHVYDRPFVELMKERSPARLRPPAWVKAWTRREIDAGADLVVMHGAPFAQGVEIYKGKPILYDLGNYIFQVPPQHIGLFGPLASESVVARVRFAGHSLRGVTLTPIVLDPTPGGAPEAARGLPAPAMGARAQAILQRVAGLSRELGTQVRVGRGAGQVVLP